MIPLQQTFDMIVTGLRRQGRKSVGTDGQPRLFGLDGCKCAAGFLIPEGEYTVAMEKIRPSLIGAMFGHDGHLVSRLANVHDSWKIPKWESKFQVIAKLFDLTYTPPEGKP